MKTTLAAILLCSLLFVATARAEGTFAGILYGQMETEDIETGNAGFVFGSMTETGLGFEAFFVTTVAEDDIGDGIFALDASTQALGLLAVYQTAGDFYVKVKAGFAQVDLEFDFDNFGKIDDKTSGFAFGAGAGYRFGRTMLEANYLVLPEFDEFNGIEIDAEVNLVSIGLNWTF